MKSKPFTSLLYLLPLIFFFYSCGSTDTVTVVEQSPENGTERADQDPDPDSEAEFMQLNAGLLEPVINLDPLFSNNLSTMRVTSLIYDGLFELNDEGEPEPKLVTDYEVSEDGREYLFTIDREIYFQDSDVFNAGVGRRIHARDIKWAFERTAKNSVPSTAAQLLMNVRGFESFFIEQQNVYDADLRVISDVSGIEVIDEETVQITLRRSDESFLHKLASPYLSIYPAEAVENRQNGLKNRPVGTGAYVLNSMDENEVTLVRNSSPRFSDQVEEYPINRIDFTSYESESEIFQNFARQNLDWIPELGPQIQRQVVNQDGELAGSYSGQFRLIEQPASRITEIYLNEKSDQNSEALKSRLNNVNAEQFTLNGSIEIVPFEESDEVEDGTDPQSYYIVFTDNPFARTLLSDLDEALFDGESTLSFVDIRYPTPETILYSSSADNIHHQLLNNSNQDLWISVETPVFGIYHNYVEGIRSTSVPWKLPVNSLLIDESERDDS